MVSGFDESKEYTGLAIVPSVSRWERSVTTEKSDPIGRSKKDTGLYNRWFFLKFSPFQRGLITDSEMYRMFKRRQEKYIYYG